MPEENQIKYRYIKAVNFTIVLLTNYLLIGNELKKLQTFDYIYFTDKSHFEEDCTQNYLVFQPMYRYLKKVVNCDYILKWKLKDCLFQKILDSTTRRPNKIWVDKGSEFCNSYFKKWLKDNDLEMYSTQ